MKKCLVFIICIFVVSCGNPMEDVKNERFNNPNADFDYDGVSNIDEVNLGQSPYINSTLINEYLGDNEITAKVRLTSDKDYIENLKFLNHKQSKDFFDKEAFVRPILSQEYAKKYNLNLETKLIDRSLYYKNVLGCLSKDQLRGLGLKYGEYSVEDIDISSPLKNYKLSMKTKFYIYDFKSLESIYFFDTNDSDTSNYKVHHFKLTKERVENGFCILYDNHSNEKKISELRPVFRYDDGQLSKSFVADKYLQGVELVRSLDLEELIVNSFLYYSQSDSKLEEFSTIKTFTDKSIIDLQEIKTGDYITVHRYISSNIKNRSQKVGQSRSYETRTNGREGRYEVGIRNGCIHYQKPRFNSKNTFKNIENLNIEEFKLNVGGEVIAPDIVNGFYLSYSFIVSNKMMKNQSFSLSYQTVTKAKFEFESIFFRQARNGRCSSESRASRFSDYIDMNNTIIIDRTGAL